METVEQMDAAIFKKAAKAIRHGENHPPLVILQKDGGTGRKWDVIDVSSAMSDETGKEVVAGLIDMVSHLPNVGIVAFVSEAWMVVNPKGGINEDTPTPSQHPERIECIVCSYSLPSGKRAISTHRIHRDAGTKPWLERGELMVEEDEKKLDGRFFAGRKVLH